MPQKIPGIGEDVSGLMPAIGADVSHLMDASPAQPAAAPDSSSFVDGAVNFVKGFAHSVDPRPALKLLYDTAQGMAGVSQGRPDDTQAFVDDLKGLGKAQIDQFTKAKQAYHEGRISEAVGHTIAGALPLVGPAAANAGEKIGAGNVAEGLGEGAGLIAPLAAKYGVEAVRTGSAVPTPARVAAAPPAALRVPGIGGPSEPVAAAAAAEGRAQGIPLDAATATGNTRIATAQKVVGDSIGGGGTAERFKAAQAEKLATVGEQLAAKANERPGAPGGAAAPGAPMTPETAGQGAMDAVGKKIGDYQQTADTAYGKLRAIEAKTPIPVDLTGVKTAIEPMYRTIATGADIAPLQGAKAAAARALARILNGPDVAGASEVDSALSDLKDLARDSADTPGAAAASRAVAQVHQALLSAVAKAGPDALQALNDGRAATTAKYAAIKVRDFLAGNSEEPVQAYGRTVARNDTNIARVRKLAELIPDEMPNIGRAFLDDVMSDATADGGFKHAARVASTWEKLGDETKGLMFKDPAHVQALDNFFRLAEKMTENVNPSGSGKIINFFNPAQLAAAGPMWALSKLLYTERGVKLLTEGFRVPIKSPTLVASYSARLGAALKQAAGMQPVTAGDTQEQTPATIGRR